MVKVKLYLKSFWPWFKDFFVSKKTAASQKLELNKRNIMILGSAVLVIFVGFSLLMPTDDARVFHSVADDAPTEKSEPRKPSAENQNLKSKSGLSKLWNGGGDDFKNTNHQTPPNYNTAMVVGGKNGNAKDQLHAGMRVRLQNVDKFIVSSDATPIIAKSVEDATTESGLLIPEGSIFYGEAAYQSSSARAQIKFNRVSLPDGKIMDISAMAVDSSGQTGIEGNVKSDAVKNTTGQVITTFIGGLAAGSVQRDVLGQSIGGIKNGLMQALSDTARDRATSYGEKMKEAREWIEIESGVYFEAVIQQSVNLRPDMNQGGLYE